MAPRPCDKPFDPAQDRPFESPQDRPFGPAQDKPFGSPQGKLRAQGDARGVVVIHGIGEQQEGETLAEVASQLADYLEEGYGQGSVQREACIGPSTLRQALRAASGQAQGSGHGSGELPRADLWIRTPQGGSDRWVFRGAWWAQAFPPPAYREMLLWTLVQGAQQLWNILTSMTNPSYQHLGESPLRVGPWIRLYDELATFSLLVLFVLGAFLVVPLLLVTWAVSFLPPVLGLGTLVRQLEHLLRGFLVRQLGDAKQYIDHGIWAANVRGRLERAILELLQEPQVRSVTVISHSWGSVIAYETLSLGGEVDRFLRRLPEAERKPVGLVTVGAGLNRAPLMVRRSGAPHARSRLFRPLLEGLTWLNLFSRHDPVPAGPLSAAIKGWAQVPPGRFKERRVVNLDDVLNDHYAYWRNREVVLPRLVKAITHDDPAFADVSAVRPGAVRRRLRQVALAGSLRLAAIYAGLAYGGMLALLPGYRAAVMERLEALALVGTGLQQVHGWLQQSSVLGYSLDGLGVWALTMGAGGLALLLAYKLLRYTVVRGV